MSKTSTLLLSSALMLGFAVSSASAAEGAEKVWKAKCASCHGMDGKGATKQGDKMGIGDMTKEDWQKEFTDEKIKKAMTDGLKRDKDGKKQDMKPFKDKLSAEEMDGLVQFIRALKK